jgi:glycosyltransferase involved in cell wall biosynthesis
MLVEHGRTGFLVEDREPSSFATCVSRILDDPTLAADLSARASARALDYSWREAAERLEAVHDELAAGHLVQC